MKVECPVCGCALNPENKTKHIVSVHLMGERSYLTDALRSYEVSDGLVCECVFCKKKVHKKGLVHHFAGMHHSLFRLGTSDKKISSVDRDEKLIGSVLKPVVRCECGVRIGYAKISDDHSKAYNVDSQNRVVEPHLCDGERKSESIYAFSAGVVDSNRRKH